MGIFSDYQTAYAAHDIVTFPLNDNKRPAVRAWNKIGMPASQKLAKKFTDADGLGFVTNKRNGVAVLDVDTPDEKALADTDARHGQTPIIIRTASGKFHKWYRYNGERRRIRPWDGLPIDLLGVGGLVVAPPTLVTKGTYCFIQGSLDDIDRLPTMRGLSPEHYVESPCIVPDDFAPIEEPAEEGWIPEGTRNNSLWRFCMTEAAKQRIKTGGTIERGALIEAARRCNADCVPPLPDSEVIEIAASAWGYETAGKNWFGAGKRIVTSHDEVDDLSQDAAYLLLVLRRHHWGRPIVVANAMAEPLGWTVKRLAKTRDELERKGKVRLIRKGNKWQGPSVYGWPSRGAHSTH